MGRNIKMFIPRHKKKLLWHFVTVPFTGSEDFWLLVLCTLYANRRSAIFSRGKKKYTGPKQKFRVIFARPNTAIGGFFVNIFWTWTFVPSSRFAFKVCAGSREGIFELKLIDKLVDIFLSLGNNEVFSCEGSSPF